MDTSELFLACRRGDLSRVQQLVEQREVDLNVRDKWDSTPLYYACLCGHEQLVRYLLDNDARCEANTFDGERCLYGALNNTIRNLLHNYKAVTASTMRRDLYIEFLRKLLERREEHTDVEFVVRGERLAAHRCVLAGRSEYFAQLLRSSWRHKTSVPVTSKRVSPHIFRSLLQYLYTARLEIAIDQVDDMMSLARHCRLKQLESSLADRLKRVASFECTKPGVRVTVLSVEPGVHETVLQSDLSQLAREALPVGLDNQEVTELPFPAESADLFADVIFSVEDLQFHCHKVFFAGRSDYFKVLLQDSFNETQCSATLCADKSCNKAFLDVVTLQDISAETFTQIVYYIYQDSCELTEENVHDVLYKADLYLLPGLKRQCSAVIGRSLNCQNVVSVVHLSRLFSLSRLEDQCTEFIATHCDQMLEREDLRALVLADARTVRGREETDSIPVIDDVRYHVTSGVQTFSDMYEAEQRLSAIDLFLQQLDLDA